MSDTHRSRLRVSREGLVLIKSFEGFRPRAVRNDDGRWMIGYGHTASAREGLTVSEQDAELLLQYDLLPVVKALNDEVPVPLNQHQFDALASFAVSVGVQRFLASDVLQRLKEDQTRKAADALFGWPETPAPDAALRRRAAERALFMADPGAPVQLADLLAAPLAPPAWEEPDPFPFSPMDGPLAPTPGPAGDVPAEDRPPWSPDQSSTPGLGQLVDEEASAPVLRHESAPVARPRLDRGETGAFLIMGLVGLGACAASAASFRKAMTDGSLTGDFAIIGWVLALIGLTCVSVASWNLYRRWEQRD